MKYAIIFVTVVVVTMTLSVVLTLLTMKAVLSSKKFRKELRGPAGPVGPMSPRGFSSEIEDISLYYVMSDNGIPMIVKGTYRDSIFNKTKEITIKEFSDKDTHVSKIDDKKYDSKDTVSIII